MKKQIFTKAIALSILLCSAFLFTNGQIPSIQWQKTIGGSGDDYFNFGKITLLSDGNYLMVGVTSSTDGDFDLTANNGGYDASVIKFNPEGTIIWSRTYGGSGDDVFNGVVELPNHKLIIAGMTTSNDFDVSGNHGGQDGWVVRLSSDGMLLSQKCYGGSGDETINDIVRISGNAYVFSGFTDSDDGDVNGNHGGLDAWVAKINQQGVISWSECYGGSADEYLFGMIKVTGNKIVIGGETFSNDGDMSGNHGDNDAFVIKLNLSGNAIWSKCIGGSGADGISYGIGKSSDGNVILPFSTTSNNGNISGNHGAGDMSIVKINSFTGNIIWQKCFGSSQEEGARGVITLNNGDIVALGATASDGFDLTTWDAQAVKMDCDGNEIWTKTFGGSDFDDVEKGIVTADGKLLLLGHTASYDGDVTNQHGPWDMWLVKLNSNCHNHRYEISTANSSENATAHLKIFPNPLSNSTIISFSLNEPQNVSLMIFDLNGRLLKTLAENVFEEGEHQIEWGAEKINAGIYFLKIQAGKFSKTEKLIITR